MWLNLSLILAETKDDRLVSRQSTHQFYISSATRCQTPHVELLTTVELDTKRGRQATGAPLASGRTALHEQQRNARVIRNTSTGHRVESEGGRRRTPQRRRPRPVNVDARPTSGRRPPTGHWQTVHAATSAGSGK